MSNEIMIQDNGELTINDIDPALLFTDAGIRPLVAEVDRRIKEFVPDISTDEGRKGVASFAYAIARTKTTVDNLGKEYVAKLKDMPKKVDAVRKQWRDLLDIKKEQVRKPLTDWEQEQERIAAQEKLDAEIDQAWKEAQDEYELRELRAQKEALEAAEQARIEAKRIEAERVEREERIRQEAEDRAKEEYERKERERIAEEKRIADEKARQAANIEHQKKINNDILEDLTKNIMGLPEWAAKEVITYIAKGKIRHITINY